MAGQRDLSEAVYCALESTLEGMVFSEVHRDPGQPAVPENKEAWLWAGIEARRPLSGRIQLCFPESLAMRITSVLYREGNAVLVARKVADVMKELVNIVAGKLLREFVAGDEIMELGLPKSGAGWPEENVPMYWFLTDEEMPIAALLDLVPADRSHGDRADGA